MLLKCYFKEHLRNNNEKKKDGGDGNFVNAENEIFIISPIGTLNVVISEIRLEEISYLLNPRRQQYTPAPCTHARTQTHTHRVNKSHTLVGLKLL